MALFLFSVRDGKADCYCPPFVCKTRGEAIRAVIESLSPDSRLMQFPDDFTLFEIGEWFEDSAVIESTVPQFVAHISSLVPGGTMNPVRRAFTPTDPQIDGVLKNGEDAVGDDAPVQSGAGSDDPEERV